MMIINNCKHVNFGYNKEYHDKLHSELSKKKQYQQNAEAFIKADKALLELEDYILELEKSKNSTKTEKFDKLTDFLIDAKQVLAFHIDSTFSNVKYSDNLIKQYLQEMKNLSDPFAITWRKWLCRKLSAFSIKDYSQELGAKPIFQQQSIGQNNRNIEDLKQTQSLENSDVNSSNNDNGVKLLTLYTPSKSSPNGFKDVVGMDDIKEELQETIVDYVKNPLQAELDEEEYGLTVPRGFLFYGPPGCGKTFIVEALAVEAGLDMYKMDVSKIGSKYINQTSRNIQETFDYLEIASKKANKPVLLFMDEVDSLARNRSNSSSDSSENLKATTTILKLIQEAKDKGIIVIAATNKFDLLDEAFVSRFDNQYYFGLPDEAQTKALLKSSLLKRLKGQNLAQNEAAIEELSQNLKGYSNRSIVFLIDKAAKIAKRRLRADITANDVKEAIKTSDFEKIKEQDFQKTSKTTGKIGFC